jgi:hypothetical protein
MKGEKDESYRKRQKAVIADKELLSISGLLDELNVEDPLYVTVELNGDILERVTSTGLWSGMATKLDFSISWMEAGDHADGRTDRKVPASHCLERGRR